MTAADLVTSEPDHTNRQELPSSSILNPNPQLLPGPELLHSLLRLDDPSRADLPALECLSSSGELHKYSYHDLHSLVQGLATKIRKVLQTLPSNTQTDQIIIPILVPQSPALYISQFAVLHAGAAFCPINLDAPAERIKFIARDVDAKVILSVREFEDVLKWEGGPEVIVMEEFPAVSGPNEDISMQENVQELDGQIQGKLAFIMYTSGSTGQPKGVAVSHRAVTQSLLAHDRHIPSFRRFLQFAAPSFDVSVFEIFFPLFRGATLVGCDRSKLLNDLCGIINELDVDAAELTPTVAGSLVQKRERVPRLNLLLTIGEMLTYPVIKEFGANEDEGREGILYGMYGPTEAAIHCTVNPCMASSSPVSNIGVPFDTVTASIAKVPASGSDVQKLELEILDFEEIGELILAGPQLAEGYLNRPEQNAAAFVSYHGKPAYRTGDKARILPNGTIEMMGRIASGQVKLRGQRVELGEIEQAIFKHEGIQAACCSILSGILVAFVQTSNRGSKAEEIQKTCKEWLPQFMIPSEIRILEEFPYLPSGKIDRKKLEADYEAARLEDNADELGDFSIQEQRVCEALKKILGGVKIGKRTKLASAGLDSLKAIQLRSELARAGLAVTSVEILGAENVEVLASLCRTEETAPLTHRPSGDGGPARFYFKDDGKSDIMRTVLEKFSSTEVDAVMPCTPLQLAMLSETVRNPSAYRNWVELRLKGFSDCNRLMDAFKEVAQHNEILRSGFVEIACPSDGFVQVVFRDLRGLQLVEVQEFSCDGPSDDNSLQHPLRIQLQRLDNGFNVRLHMHHALYDAWSLELIIDDLESLLVTPNDRLIQRNPFSIVVADYLAQVDDERITQRSVDYWEAHLSQLDPLPLPNFNTTVQSNPGLDIFQHETSISTAELDRFAREFGVSSQSFFQTAFAIILSSYLGSTDICIGTVFSGRTLPIPGIENIVGPCLATLPVRIDLEHSSTFVRSLIQKVNRINRQHLEYSTLPLRDIKKACGADPSRSLFDALLVWQQTLHSPQEKRNLVEVVAEKDYLEFVLTLEITPGRENIQIKANYQRALFPAPQIDLLLRQIDGLVSAFISNPETTWEEWLSCLDDGLLSIDNIDIDHDPPTKTLASDVEAVAAQDPNRHAIEFAKSINGSQAELKCATYGQLNLQANQIAHHLIEKCNVLPDELVCICMEKSTSLYASILATIKAGAGYLPITPDAPLERIRYILKEAKVKILLALSSHQLGSLDGVEVVLVDKLDLNSLEPTNPKSRSRPENLAYAVFTSGSTGTPKGVLVTQGNLVSNLDVLQEMYPADQNARLLQSCSQAFDVSVFEIFFTWRVGGCLCSATKSTLFLDIEYAIRVFQATHLSLTPTVASLIDPDNVPSVKFLVTAGEAVTEKVKRLWEGRGLWQGYGPSETTNICTIRPRVSSSDFINNIGPAFSNTSAFVLRPLSSPAAPDEFVPTPRGGDGEFCFGGTQVFRGYLNPEQNIGKILEHPKYGKLYRSGDFGRLLPDGSLAFTGRKDDQVKIRGQRVELGEINRTLLREKLVKDCFTLVVGGEAGQQRLISFWMSTEQKSGGEETLRSLTPEESQVSKLFDALEASLPTYMVPSSLIPVSILPSTAQGKIDRRLLISHYRSLSPAYLNRTSKIEKAISDYSWTDLDLRIVEIMADITRVSKPEIGPMTSFFGLGLDSISAIQVARRLRAAGDANVEISDVLKFSSVAKLSRQVARKRADSADDHPGTRSDSGAHAFKFADSFISSTRSEFSLAKLDAVSVLPCTPLQEAMLLAAESGASDDEGVYSNHIILAVNGDWDRLRGALITLVSRQEILRTCFVRSDQSKYAYAQVVLTPECYEIDFHHLDLDGTAPAEDFVRAVESINKARGPHQPSYNLAFTGPNGAGRQIGKLVVSMHHALYDGVAMALFFDEVERLYRGEQLPEPVSFKPFLDFMTSSHASKSDGHWDSLLKDFVPTPFPKLIHSSSQKSDLIGSIKLSRNAKLSLSWIENRIRDLKTPLLAVLQSSWAALLSLYLHKTDVCFGNVVSGRSVPVNGVEHLIAPCFNTIPVRLSHLGKLSYLEGFRRLQSINAESLEYQLTPLRRIQSRFLSDLSNQKLFDTLFILQQPFRELDDEIWTIEEDIGEMDLPIVCEVMQDKGKDSLEIVIHARRDLVSKEDVELMINFFEDILSTALQAPSERISDLSLRFSETIQLIPKVQCGREETSSTKATAAEKSQTSSPWSKTETEIRQVLAEFTEIPIAKIRKGTSIFRLGLDSISAVQVAAQMRKKGYQVLASDILKRPTIMELAAHLGVSQGTGDVAATAKFDFDSFTDKHLSTVRNKLGPKAANEIERVRPCTPVQTGMIAQTLHSGGKDYINSVWMELLPNTDMRHLKEAWEEVVRKHEMLRTGFVRIEDPKFPFGMVTFASRSRSVWGESVVQEGPLDVVQMLLQSPWKIKAVQSGEKIAIHLQMHHALYDAQSLHLILSDVIQAYQSESGSHGPQALPLDPLVGAIITASTAQIEEQEAFWASEENKLPITKFPDLTPLKLKNSASKILEQKCSLDLKQLRELCKMQNVTLQAAGQVAWGKILAAYTGENVVTFGVTLSGRSIPDVENAEDISFPSIVTLPVRCEISGSNEEVLAKTMTYNGKLSQFQFTPLASIQRWAGYPEGKIFDTLFALQKLAATGSARDVRSNELWKITREEAAVDYAVSIELELSSKDELLFRLTFQESLVPEEHAELILKQFYLLLKDLLQEPGRQSGDLPVLGGEILSITPAKEPTILIEHPVTAMHQFVEQRAVSMPDNIAFEFATNLEPGHVQKKTWSYRQLNEESNRVAQMLLSSGVEQGGLVGIYFDKCPEASFAILGILKSGCSYVALDPTAPIDRFEFIMKDSEAKVVLTAGTAGDKIRASGSVKIIALDESGLLTRFESSAVKLPRPVSGHDTCYCLYTSGTTGTPKGCEITHENAVQAMLAFQRLFAGHWQSDSKWLQFASFHFDVSVLELFWSWSIGICVTSAPRDLIFEDIASAIRELGVSHIDLTPSLARTLTPEDVPSLCRGVFITGGESLKQEILDSWGEKCVIYNGYGPTEATIGVTMYPRVPVNGNPTNIGPQFDNVGSFVLKPGTSDPVLRGAVGELCVSGKLVGKGYLKRPDLTRERFAFLENFKERVYRTGDLVRILHNGDFIFLGRADDQVKLRGQRLELSEINEVMKKGVDGLKEVSTLVLKHSKQQKEQLVTFFVPSEQVFTSSDSFLSGTVIDVFVAQLRQACMSRLPGYMVPTHFLALQKFPLNANNKTDNKALAKMYDELTLDVLQGLSSASSRHKAWTGTETRVVNILSEAFQMNPQELTRDMNIFQLGMDSITIIGLTRKLQNAGLANAKLATVMSTPGIGNLVEKMLAGSSRNDAGREAYLIASQKIAAFSQMHMMSVMKELGLERDEIESLAPCTPLQEGMIFQFLESDRPVYVTGFDFALDSNVDVGTLEEAWKRAVQKVGVLRTRFVITGDGVAQVVVRAGRLIWHKIVDREGEKKSRESIHRNFCALLKKDISGCPFGVSIVEGSQGTIMSLQIFHAIYDGDSLPMILRLVSDEYAGTDSRPGPPFQAVLPHGPLAAIRGAKDYWQRALQSSRYHTFSSLVTHTSPRSVSASSTISGLDIEQLAQSLNSTSQAVLQAAWASILCSYLAQGRVTFGMVISGRAIDFEDSDHVIGPLFNTVPFQAEIKPTTTWKSLIQDCHSYNTNTLPYQHTPLRDIQKWCAAGVNQPIFDTLFVFQHASQGGDDLAIGGLWTPLPGIENSAEYLLNLEARLKKNGDVELLLAGRGSVVDEAAASDILGKLEVALRKSQDLGSFVDPQIPLSSPCSSHSGESFVMIERSLTPPSSLDTFLWNDDACAIRYEIVSLAQLDDENVNESESIFEFGLDSIDVIKLSSRLKKKNMLIPVSVIIKCQNISKMVEYLSRQAPTESSSLPQGKSLDEYDQELREYLTRTNMLPENVVSVLPATSIQEAMIAEMISSGYTRYFNHEILRLETSIDSGMLKSAWMKVIHQSDILRTSFAEIDDSDISATFAQLVHSKQEIAWEICDGAGEADFDAHVARAIDKCKNRGPLLQLTLVKYGCDNYLVFSIAHALYDGASLQMLHEDVWKAYNGMPIDRPHHQAAFLQILNTNEVDASNFWKMSLSGINAASFPQESENRSDAVNRAERASTVKIGQIQTFCKGLGISLQTVGQTCWALILASYLKKLDVVFGAVLSCRDTEQANEMMFPFMNTVAVRSIVHGTLVEMLQYMQEAGNAIRQYQHFPLRKAQALAAVGGRLFDTLFIYQGRQRDPLQEGQPLYSAVGGASEVEYPVCVEMEIVGDELVWRTACKDSALNASETGGLLFALDQVLNRMMSTPHSDTISSSSDGLSICGRRSFREDSTVSESGQESGTDQKDNQTSWSEMEKRIRRIISKVSQIPETDIGREHSIYNLGLDSISAIKVSALLRRQGLQLTVGNMVKHFTISAMANVATPLPSQSQQSHAPKQILHQHDLLKELDVDALATSIGIDRQNIELILPLSPGQLYMVRRWQESNGALFYPTFEYRVKNNSSSSSIDADKMAGAWEILQSQLPILRTLPLHNVGLNIPAVQVVLKQVDSPMVLLSPDDEPIKPLYQNSVEKPPVTLMLRQQVDTDSPTTTTTTKLCLQIHHALYDAVSLPLMLRHLQDLYNNPNSNSNSKITPLSHHNHTTLTFPSFLTKTSTSTSTNTTTRKQFWTSYLLPNNIKPTPKTTSNSSAITTTRKKKRTDIFKPAVLNSVSALKSRARHLNVTVDALILAAFATVYAASMAGFGSGRNDEGGGSNNEVARNGNGNGNGKDVIFGVYLANRSHEDADFSGLEAPTVNILPVLVRGVGVGGGVGGCGGKSEGKITHIENLATQIQSDLNRFKFGVEAGDGDMDGGGVSVMGTSLEEIWKWTGVRVGWVVNVLKGGGDGDSGSSSSSSSSSSSASSGIILEKCGFDLSQGFERERIIEGFDFDLDLDLEVRGRGVDVDIGVEAGAVGVGAEAGAVDAVGGTGAAGKRNEKSGKFATAAYLDSVDIEIGIVGDVLNVGVFAPEEVLRLGEGMGVMGGLGEVLGVWGGGGGGG